MKSKSGKRVPIKSSKDIGVEFGYTQVIVVAFDKLTGTTSVSTWGKDQTDCEQAAQGGNFVKKALGWPPEKCEAKPSRQIKNEKMTDVLKSLVEIYSTPHENDTVNIVRYSACAELAKRLIK